MSGEKLKLEPHPAGSYFRQRDRAETLISARILPRGIGGERVASTAIYFLLEGRTFCPRIGSAVCDNNRHPLRN